MAYVQHTKCIAPSSWSGLAPGLIARPIPAPGTSRGQRPVTIGFCLHFSCTGHARV
jgi:hypothetical protein